MTQEIFLRPEPVASLVQAGQGIAHVRSVPPVRVPIPPLQTGQVFFGLWPVREIPDQGAWSESDYETCAPPVFVARDALVHGAAGIVSVAGSVIAETIPAGLAASDGLSAGQAGFSGDAGCGRPDQAVTLPGIRMLARGIGLTPLRKTQLAGMHVSLLAAGAVQPDIALLHGLARLACIPDSLLLEAESILLPAGTASLAEMLALLDLLPSLAVREVSPDETFQVESLILPLTLCGGLAFHPCLLDFFARLSGAVPAAPAGLPRRLFVTSAAAAIVSENEAEVIAALRPLGFAAVALWDLPLARRIALLRQAEAVVAPQHPGLASLGFCRPGCLVVELLPAEDVNWRFRRLAALCHLAYDCVLGRQGKLSAAHVAAAVAAGLGQCQAAA